MTKGRASKQCPLKMSKIRVGKQEDLLSFFPFVLVGFWLVIIRKENINVMWK